MAFAGASADGESANLRLFPVGTGEAAGRVAEEVEEPLRSEASASDSEELSEELESLESSEDEEDEESSLFAFLSSF